MERADARRATLLIMSLFVLQPLAIGGWRVHWLIAFFVLTMAFALALRGPMKVEL